MQGVKSELLASHSYKPRRLVHFPENWAFSHSWTTTAKCGGVPSCIKLQSSISSQALIIGQTSFFNIPFGVHGIMKDEGPQQSYPKSFHALLLSRVDFLLMTWHFVPGMDSSKNIESTQDSGKVWSDFELDCGSLHPSWYHERRKVPH